LHVAATGRFGVTNSVRRMSLIGRIRSFGPVTSGRWCRAGYRERLSWLLRHTQATLVRCAVAMPSDRLMTISVSSASGSDEQQLRRRGQVLAVGAA
jgi:hypothetical protein